MPNVPDSTALVEKVQKNDRRARILFIAAASVVIIAVLTFLSVFSILNERKLQTVINNNHAISSAQNKQELDYIKAQSQASQNRQALLEMQNRYLACLISLFTNSTSVTQAQADKVCPDPFADAQPVSLPASSSSGSTSTSTPKASTKSSSSSSSTSTSSGSNGGSTTGSSSSSGTGSTSNGGGTETPLQHAVRVVTDPVTVLLNGVQSLL